MARPRINHEEITEKAHKRWNEAQVWNTQINRSKALLAFRDGQQWDAQKQQERNSNRRPTEVLNVCHSYIKRLVNPYLESPLLSSVDMPNISLADFGLIDIPPGISLKELITQVLSQIEEDSGAVEAIYNAYENGASCGIGYWRIGAEYTDDEGIEQKICYYTIDDIGSVYPQPGRHKNSLKGIRWCFFVDSIPEDEVPSDLPRKLSSTFNIGGTPPVGHVQEVLYYELIDKPTYKYFSINTDDVWYENELPDGIKWDAETDSLMGDDGLGIPVRRRKIKQTSCRIFKFIDSVLYEWSEIPVSSIPFFRVVGDKLAANVNGSTQDSQMQYVGLIYWMKSVQQMMNFHANNEIELSGLAPKSQWMSPKAAIEGHEDAWDYANTAPPEVLLWNHVNENGEPIPAPQRIDNTPQTGAAMASKIQCLEMMDIVTGMPRALFGESSGANEAGVTIFQKTAQGEIPTIHYPKHLQQALEHCIDVMLDMIPIYYDTERDFILNIRGRKRIVKLNLSQIFTKQLRKYLKSKVNGGPSSEIKRKEGNAALLSLTALDPMIAKASAVPLIEATGSPRAQDVAKTLTTLDPSFAMPDDQDEEEQLIPASEVQRMIAAEAEDSAQLEAQVEQLMLENQQMARYIEQAQNALQSKEQETIAKIITTRETNESRERIAAQNNATKIATEAQKQQNENAREMRSTRSAIFEQIMVLLQDAMQDEASQTEIELQSPMMNLTFENEPKENESKENGNDYNENATLTSKPDMPTLVKGGLKFADQQTELGSNTED